MPRLLAAAILALACACPLAAAQTGPGKWSLYADPVYLFRISYPDGWRPVHGTMPYAVFFAGNEAAGAAQQSAGVRVYPLANPGYADPAEFVFQFLSGLENAGGLEEFSSDHPLRGVYPDIKAVDYGETTLGGASAFFIASRCTVKSGDAKVPVSIMQIATIRGGDVYEVITQAGQDRIEEARPVLSGVVASFFFE